MPRNFAYDFSGQLADLVMKGKADFASLAQSIIKDILQIALQVKLVNPLLQSMGILPNTGRCTRCRTCRRSCQRWPGHARQNLFSRRERPGAVHRQQHRQHHTQPQNWAANTQVNIYTQPGETAETRTRQGENGDIIEVFMKTGGQPHE